MQESELVKLYVPASRWMELSVWLRMLGLLSVRAMISSMKWPAGSRSFLVSAVMAEVSKIRLSSLAIWVAGILCKGAKLLSSA